MSSYPSRQDPETDNLPATATPVEAVPLPALAQAPTEPVQLSDYASIIGSRWRLVAFAALLGCVCGVLLTLVQKPKYRVKTSIEIQNINGEFLNMKQTGHRSVSTLRRYIRLGEMFSQNAASGLGI